MTESKFYHRMLHVVNGVVSMVAMAVVFLWVTDNISLNHFELAATWIKTSVEAPRLWAAFLSLLLIAGTIGGVILYFMQPGQVDRLTTETDDEEISVSIRAAEDTLERAVQSLADIHNVDIQIRKPDQVLSTRSDPDEAPRIQIEAVCTTREKSKFKEVAEQVRSILRERFADIIEVDRPPFLKINLGGIIHEEDEEDRTGEDAGDTSTEDEDPYLSESFSGPEYPVEDDE